MWRIYLIFFIVSLIIGWISKITLKRRLSQKLNRHVSDHELTSLKSWMEEPTVSATSAVENKQPITFQTHPQQVDVKVNSSDEKIETSFGRN